MPEVFSLTQSMAAVAKSYTVDHVYATCSWMNSFAESAAGASRTRQFNVLLQEKECAVRLTAVGYTTHAVRRTYTTART